MKITNTDVNWWSLRTKSQGLRVQESYPLQIKRLKMKTLGKSRVTDEPVGFEK